MQNITQSSVANLCPDPVQMRQQLDALFEGLDEYNDGLVEIAFNIPGNDNVTNAQLFPLNDIETAIAFATVQNTIGSNIYVGVTLRKPGGSKSCRSKDADFYAGNVAWVDIDERTDATWSRIQEANLGPTVAVVTGTVPEKRLHCYFRLDKPCVNAEEIRNVNISLQKFLSTDAVANPCRIMRLAGTVSYPKSAKVAKGYVVEATSFHFITNNVYSIENIIGLLPEQASSQLEHTLTGSVKNPGTIPDELQTLVTRGAPLGRRSEQFHRVITWFKGLGYAVDEIEAELSKFPAGIAEKYDGRLRQEIERCFEKADGGFTERDNAIEEINQSHALVLAGSKAVVLQEYVDEYGESNIRLLSSEDFNKWHGNRFIQTEDGRKPLSRVWLSSPKRRQYEGIAFSPNGAPNGYYNLWRGFAVEPSAEGSCQLLLGHIFNNVCQGNEDLYWWVIGWFAQMVQEPEIKLGTALVLRGKQGCGKTIVGSMFGKLFGHHYVQVADPRYIVGRFNSHMSSALFLHCDEGFWAGDKAAEGKLKDLVTGEHQLIEFKGKEPIKVRNLIRLFVTSNNGWVVPAGFEERRFCVLDVSDAHIQDSTYFSALFEQMENGGYEALLHFLQQFDLTKVNLRQIPQTSALTEQKIASMQPEEAWWHSCLVAERILDHEDHWPAYIGCKEAHEAYLAHAKDVGTRHRANSIQLGLEIARLVPGRKRDKRMIDRSYIDNFGVQRTYAKRDWAYILPGLADCRRAFTNVVGTDFLWDEGE
jgi:hypothetical protein